MVGPNDKDDGSLSLSRYLPSSPASDLPKEEVDHGLPHHDEKVVEHARGERAPLVERHGDAADDGARESEER